jgi:hypothetical protein
VVPEGVRLIGGSVVEDDLIVLATGYGPYPVRLAEIFGEDIARRREPVWAWTMKVRSVTFGVLRPSRVAEALHGRDGPRCLLCVGSGLGRRRPDACVRCEGPSHGDTPGRLRAATPR